MGSKTRELPTETTAISVVDQIVKAHSEIWELRIVEYDYVQHALDDHNRIERRVLASRIRKTGLSVVLDERTQPGWDVALYSKVRLRTGVLRHIPMMDFKTRRDSEALANLKEQWAKVVGRPGYFLRTDNSYHWYGAELLTHGEWVRFMGRALLCNLDNLQIVDARFVGHRLYAGCGSLRLVGNRQRGTEDPILLEII